MNETVDSISTFSAAWPSVDFTLQRPRWISDILLTEEFYNNTKIDAESPQFESFIWGSVALLVIYLCSTVINLIFMVVLIFYSKTRRIMKLKVLICCLTGVNLVWSVLWLCVTISSYILQADDEVLQMFQKEDDGKMIAAGVWEIVAHQLVDNLLAAQTLLIFTIAMDRYLNLFSTYSPYMENKCMLVLLSITPFVLSWTLFDHRLLALVLPESSAVFCRLCLLLCPCLLSFVLLLIASLRPSQDKTFEPRLTSSLSKSLPPSFLAINIVDLIWRTGFFFRILESDFDFQIVTGSEEGDQILGFVFSIWYSVSVWLLHLSHLIYPMILMTCVKHYRMQLRFCCVGCKSTICCGSSNNSLPYSSETMRSILAQSKKQQMMRPIS